MGIFQAFLIALLIIVIAAFGFGFYRSVQTQNDARNQQFVKGTAPDPLPDGLQKGIVNLDTSWEGKKFDAKDNSGVNMFKEHGEDVEKYPFKTSMGKGTIDTTVSVEKIDYNIDSNPFWLRFVLDEIVQTGDGKYLGKLIIRALPGINFALGFFELEKQQQ